METIEQQLQEWNRIRRYLDISYSYVLAKRMEEPRTNPVLGYRTAGSRAEFETGELLAAEMRAIGLSVEKHRFTLDGWDFHHARLTYKDEEGRAHTAELGSYQTDFDTKGPKHYTLIDAGTGTAAELDRLDVRGKLVLVHINQRNDWWINYPAYQAHLRGAAAILAVQAGGYGEVDEQALNAQNICGPRQAPAFSISRKDAAALAEAAHLGFGRCAEVTLDALSTVMPETESYNIVGALPGEDTDEMILVSAHYDSYFEGFQDDNTAVSLMLGMARALKLAGYKPKKTLVFCAFAAEEWGVIDSRYDWSTGAYNQIFRVRPDWAGRVIANINLELPAHAHGKKHQVRSVYELKRFLKECIRALPQEVANLYPKGVGVVCPVQTWSDDFSMAIGGVPSMVDEFGGGRFMATHYHSQFDNDGAYDEKVYLFHHLFYTWVLLRLDRCVLPPLDFAERLWALDASLTSQKLSPQTEGAFRKKLAEAARRADKLTRWVWKVNQGEVTLEEADRAALRRRLLELFRLAQDCFVRLDWSENAIFPHENTQANLSALHTAAWQLAAGMGRQAVESLCGIDDNRYANAFDPAVVDYFADKARNQPPERLMWGTGRLQERLALGSLLRRIKAEETAEKPDHTAALAQVKQLKKDQQELLKEIVKNETADLARLSKALKQATGEFFAGKGE